MYEPKTGISKVLLKKELNKCSLKKNKDPYKWLPEIEKIETRMRSLRSEINDTDLIILILYNLTPEYDIVVENIENRLGEDYNKIELKKVRQSLGTKHQRLNVMRNNYETEDNEELTDVVFLAKFKKRLKNGCNVCGNIRR